FSPISIVHIRGAPSARTHESSSRRISFTCSIVISRRYTASSQTRSALILHRSTIAHELRWQSYAQTAYAPGGSAREQRRLTAHAAVGIGVHRVGLVQRSEQRARRRVVRDLCLPRLREVGGRDVAGERDQQEPCIGRSREPLLLEPRHDLFEEPEQPRWLGDVERDEQRVPALVA